MKALLLAGGPATRLYPFTKTRPKPMLPIANQTMLYRNLIGLKEAGINSIVIVTHANDQITQATFQRGKELGMQIEYVQQNKEGIGWAIHAARDKFISGQYFLLGYADILTTENIYSHTLQIFNGIRAPLAAVCLTSSSSHLYGNVYLDEEMRISKIVEKPESKEMGNFILGGVYILPFDFFNILEESKGEMTDALHELIVKFGLSAANWEKSWIDINYPWSILQANQLVLEQLKESRIAADVHIPRGISISGPVIIESGVKIKEGAVIQGPSIIGRNCFIGHNALIREHCSLGPNSLVGYGTELKNCVIFGDAIIGRISYIGDSVVGSGAHIGSGTMTINYPIDATEVLVPIRGQLRSSKLRKLGAFIGDNASIGASNTIQAGAVIDQGAIIPDHYTVGRGETR